MSSNLICNIDWSAYGAAKAAERGDIVVIVDVLSFSTTVAIATERKIEIYPSDNSLSGEEVSSLNIAEISKSRNVAANKGGFSLSPTSFINAGPGIKVALISPNGAQCCLASQKSPYSFVGSFLNAANIANTISSLMQTESLSTTIIACGERQEYGQMDGAIRFAVEDYLGAGAILASMQFQKTAEARVCEMAFEAARPDLLDIIGQSQSGRELIDIGFNRDVEIACQLNTNNAIPVFINGFIRNFE